jgi:hypothetical protein
MIIDHKKIGIIKMISSFEKNGKNVILAEKKFAKESEVKYFVLWGNISQPNEDMSYTEMISDKGNPRGIKKSIENFLLASESLDHIYFEKI